jgi:hypothetical protein
VAKPQSRSEVTIGCVPELVFAGHPVSSHEMRNVDLGERIGAFDRKQSRVADCCPREPGADSHVCGGREIFRRRRMTTRQPGRSKATRA